jgi:very-short-patch-repair endonuclease
MCKRPPRVSSLEARMELLLKRRGIYFEREKLLPGLRFRNPLRCDFYIPRGQISRKRAAIIEVDGPHHFMGCRKRQTRDLIKNTYAIHHGLHFLRVDYTAPFEDALDAFIRDIQEAPLHIVKHNFAGSNYAP